MEQTSGQILEKELLWKFPNIAKEKPEWAEKADRFCIGYKAFLDQSKTERETHCFS